MGCSLPGSSVLGISQARILEWVAISFSRGSSLPRDQTHISCLPGSFLTIEPPGKSFDDSLLVVFIGLYWWYVSSESSKRTGIRVITLAGTELTAISPPITSGSGWQVYLHAMLAEEAHDVVETHDEVETQSLVLHYQTQ